MHHYIGIEIGGTKLQLVAGSTGADILERRTFAVTPSGGAAGIRRQIEQGLEALTRDHKPAGIGVGFGGPVDWKTGTICRSHQIEGWSDFPLAEWLQERSGSQVFVENDANVAALGEAILGAGVGFNPVFYVTLGSGVGGGLVVNSQIYHGQLPGEAEIGHLRLDRAGTTVESRCAGWAIDRKVRALAKEKSSSILSQFVLADPHAEARHLGPALQQGDPGAARLLRELGEDLAFGLSHAVHLFHPEIILLGGGLAGLGEPLREAVAQSLSGFVMEAFQPGAIVALSKLGNNAVPAGALELARSAACGEVKSAE